MNHSQVFSKRYKTLCSTDAVVPEFKLLHNFPIQIRSYPIPKIEKMFAKKEIKELLEAGIIEPSVSNYNFPVIFVKKKSADNSKEQKFRMVVDYHLLNSITESFQICLLKISEILHQIVGKKYYCVLDLKSAFFQIKLQDCDKPKLVFCYELGNFMPTRLFFGSRNSTSYFHTLLTKCISVQFYLDDIIIGADEIEKLLDLLQ